MKKTFKQLTVGDVFYYVIKHRNEFNELTVLRVEPDELSYGYNYDDRIKRPSEYVLKSGNYYYFTSKEDVIRYCKAQTVKTLIGMINKAKESIKEVREFKLKNYEILNKDWMEYELTLLENQIKQH